MEKRQPTLLDLQSWYLWSHLRGISPSQEAYKIVLVEFDATPLRLIHEELYNKFEDFRLIFDGPK